jgi:hypothetical protein
MTTSQRITFMDEKNIMEITSEQLTYLDENGERQFINFAVCYQKYLDKWNDPTNVKRFKEVNLTRSDGELEASLERIKARKEVGGRDFSVPYIEFYTEPPTRFYFSNLDEFHKVEDLIRKAGWRIFDRA